jgi:hypothetical protein
MHDFCNLKNVNKISALNFLISTSKIHLVVALSLNSDQLCKYVGKPKRATMDPLLDFACYSRQVRELLTEKLTLEHLT